MADFTARTRRDDLYAEVAQQYGSALERLARGYEGDRDKRRDLVQEIHILLWRSLDRFDGRCSLRTWVYRVAHNAATSLVLRRRARLPTLVGLDEVAEMSGTIDAEESANRQHALARLMALVRTLRPVDRQVMLLYLEGENADAIGEVVGLSPSNVATRVHRVKQILVRQFYKQEP